MKEILEQIKAVESPKEKVELKEISPERIKSIDEVFKTDPELENVVKETFNKVKEKYLGPYQFYVEYLESIFPDSKVKDIVWHGTGVPLRFDEKRNGFEKKMWDVTYFTKDFNYAKSFAKRSGINFGTDGVMYPVILNVVSPINVKIMHSHDVQEVIDKLQNRKNDSVIGNEQGYNIESIGVYSPEQVHILGSKSDIENFKNWAERSVEK
jgi:hypothetical protein